MPIPTYEELYKKQIRIERIQDSGVVFLTDTTEEDVNWLRRGKESV